MHDEIGQPDSKGEYSSKDECTVVSDSPTFRSRLKKFIHFWREINASKLVLDTIESGYKIPFIQTPTPYNSNNNASARNHSAFVTEAVNELLAQRCIEELTHKPSL